MGVNPLKRRLHEYRFLSADRLNQIVYELESRDLIHQGRHGRGPYFRRGVQIEKITDMRTLIAYAGLTESCILRKFSSQKKNKLGKKTAL